MIYFETLPWDSSFFKFPVARIVNEINIFSFEIILQNLFENNISLAYYSTTTQLTGIENSLYNIRLVDRKTTFIKQINAVPIDGHITFYSKTYPEKKLVQLAIESGIYSRFNIDEKIGRQNFEDLYTQWIIKSVSKEIANEVLVYKFADEITGFVTIGEKNNRADIGIIAVDAGFRGKGIGKALMLAAENICSKKHIYIQVVTQGDNIAACKLYESCGYTTEKVEYFYHLWKKD